MRPDPERDAIYAPAVDDIRHARNRIWTGRCLVLGALLMAMFNAEGVVRWAASQPPVWAVETVRLTLQTWEDRMDQAGLTAPRQLIGERYEALKRLQWADIEPETSEDETRSR
ncbi:MAG: hypothetical protein AAFX09_06470 [Pseudomonadota bacterium]